MAMPKGRSVVEYLPSHMLCIDLGDTKTPRFVLYNQQEDKSIAKSNNPIDFDEIVFGKEIDEDEPTTKTKAKKNSARTAKPK